MMTRRERLRRCYFHEELDRPAVYSRTYFPSADPSYVRLRVYLEEFTERKQGWAPWRAEPAHAVDVTVEPYSEDFERRIEILHTPKGDLRRSFLLSRKGLPGMEETHYIKDREDAERYLSLPEQYLTGDFDSFFTADAAIGDAGIVDVHLGYNPGGRAAELCGSENFALMTITDRDVLHEICERETRKIISLVKSLHARGVGPFFSMAGEELIAPPLHGPDDFADFNTRYDRRIIEAVHDGGGRMHIHCHGDLEKVLAQFIEMGCDVLHPFEGAPTSLLTPRAAKAVARGRQCLEGNIQINRLYEREPAEIAEETRQLIADAFDDRRGLIVSPTASPYIRGAGEACFERYRAMVETVLAADAKAGP